MSNLSDIGFDVKDEEGFNDLINGVYPHCRNKRVAEGWYTIYEDPSGAELWLQINNDNTLIGVNPHFNGKTKRRVFITGPVNRTASILDGAYHSWANPRDENDSESGDYPFVFDMPDAKTVSVQPIPAIRYIQLTAFAQDINVYASEEEFFASQTSEFKYASQSFIPSGLFTSADNDDDTSSDCVFAGYIREFEVLENSFTKQKFYWLRIDTLGGEVDVVGDVAFFKNEPVVDGILHGNFWLSARILSQNDKPTKKNFFQRLFQK